MYRGNVKIFSKSLVCFVEVGRFYKSINEQLMALLDTSEKFEILQEFVDNAFCSVSCIYTEFSHSH